MERVGLYLQWYIYWAFPLSRFAFILFFFKLMNFVHQSNDTITYMNKVIWAYLLTNFWLNIYLPAWYLNMSSTDLHKCLFVLNPNLAVYTGLLAIYLLLFLAYIKFKLSSVLWKKLFNLLFGKICQEVIRFDII